MRKSTFYICENKGTDYCAADQHLCFHYIDSTIHLLPKIESLLSFFRGCTARFVSDLVETPEGRFSHDTAHLALLF